MRARDVVGRTIVSIAQERCYDSCGALHYDVVLVFDNGDRLYPLVGELEGDYAVDFVVNKTGRRRARQPSRARAKISTAEDRRHALEGGGKYRPIGCTCTFVGPARLRRFGCRVHPGTCTVEEAWQYAEHSADGCDDSDCPYHGVRARHESNG